MALESKDMFTSLVIGCLYDVYLRHILPLITLKDMLSMRIVASAYSVESDFVTFRDVMSLERTLIDGIASSNKYVRHSRFDAARRRHQIMNVMENSAKALEIIYPLQSKYYLVSDYDTSGAENEGFGHNHAVEYGTHLVWRV